MTPRLVLVSSRSNGPLDWLDDLALRCAGSAVNRAPLEQIRVGGLADYLEGTHALVFLLNGLEDVDDAVGHAVQLAWRARVAAELAGVKRVVLAGGSAAGRGSDMATARRLVEGVFEESSVPLVALPLPRQVRAPWASWLGYFDRRAQVSVDAILSALDIRVEEATA